jgi:hypothetical protein
MFNIIVKCTLVVKLHYLKRWELFFSYDGTELYFWQHKQWDARWGKMENHWVHWHSLQRKLRPLWNFDSSDSVCLKKYVHILVWTVTTHIPLVCYENSEGHFLLVPNRFRSTYLPEKVSKFLFVMAYPITRLFPPHNTWLPSILCLETISAFSASSGSILKLFTIDFKITFRHIDPQYAEIVTKSAFSALTLVPWATPEFSLVCGGGGGAGVLQTKPR